jgi:hypothetical protein
MENGMILSKVIKEQQDANDTLLVPWVNGGNIPGYRGEILICFEG